MLPRWHIFWGAVLSLILFLIVPGIGYVNLILVFLSSFLIDFDHYAASVIKTGKWSLFKSFEYHREKGRIQREEQKKGIRTRGDFHLFHTLEFHLFVFILGIIYSPFMFIFIGMAFHSMLDLIYLTYYDYLYKREFFLVEYLRRKYVK